jgi:hypothetical protein
LLVAYGLILLMVLAAIGIALALRHNSRAVKIARDDKRQRERREAKLLDK